MLILTRRVGEGLMIEDPDSGKLIEVRVLGVKGNQVRMGIEAPKEIMVNREEIHNRIKNNEPRT